MFALCLCLVNFCVLYETLTVCRFSWVVVLWAVVVGCLQFSFTLIVGLILRDCLAYGCISILLFGLHIWF